MKAIKGFALCLILAGIACFSVRPLKLPFDVPKGVVSHKVFDCAASLPAPGDLIFTSPYDQSDKTKSTIDADNYLDYKGAVEPIAQFEKRLTSQTNAYIRSGGKDSKQAVCALRDLENWASADALLGEANAQGEAVRKWTLATLSSSYAQISHDPNLTSSSKRKVEKWLGKIALRVIKDSSSDPDKVSRHNNHMYWSGYAVAMTGAAINNRVYLSWGIFQAKRGLADIQPDGTLPNELSRGARALHYHIFATAPLVMLAKLAAANNVRLKTTNLPALVHLDLEGLSNPGYFQQLTGVAQDMGNDNSGSALAWLEIYNHLVPDADVQEYLARYRPMVQKRLGGDTTLLYGNVR